MQQQTAALEASFAAVSRETWRKALEASLGGAALQAALARRTEDGLALKTLYAREDWPAGRSGAPGRMPFTRGRLAPDKAESSWDIRCVVDAPALAEARAALAADLEGGAGSMALRLDTTPVDGLADRQPEGPWGLRLSSLADLEALFDGVARLPPLALEAGALALPLGLALIALARKRKASLRAELNVDPLSALAADGRLQGGVESALGSLGALAVLAAASGTHIAAVGVDTRPHHMAGACEAQEIAFALATGAQYLRALDKAGLPPEKAVPQLCFVFAVDGRFFRSLVKLRAFRLCFARLAQACGVPEEGRGARIWAETSLRDLSRRDPHVNILRGTAGCFAAALGGADAISVRPFDEASGVPALFSRRIARNTGLVLAEEGGLARVLDPAGGAWALESMTEAFAEKAWALFQDIERAGGMAQALVSGKAGAMIADVAAVRARMIETGEWPLTAVTIFPAAEEEAPAPVQIDWPALARAEQARALPLLSQGLARAMRPGAEGRLEAAIEALLQGASFASVGKALAGKGWAVARRLAPQRLSAPFEAPRSGKGAPQ